MRVQIDARELQKYMEILPELKVRRATKLALNDSGRQANTEASREIRKKWNLKAAVVKERVRINAWADERDLSVTITAGEKGKGEGIDLTHFGARWTRGNRAISRDGGVKVLKRSQGKGGVTVSILRGERTVLRHAFIARMKSGHMGVFVREGKDRTPLIRKGAISVASMFDQEQVEGAIRRKVEDVFPRRFDHHIDRVIARL